jgi:hypothetical protein
LPIASAALSERGCKGAATSVVDEGRAEGLDAFDFVVI